MQWCGDGIVVIVKFCKDQRQTDVQSPAQRLHLQVQGKWACGRGLPLLPSARWLNCSAFSQPFFSCYVALPNSTVGAALPAFQGRNLSLPQLSLVPHDRETPCLVAGKPASSGRHLYPCVPLSQHPAVTSQRQPRRGGQCRACLSAQGQAPRPWLTPLENHPVRIHSHKEVPNSGLDRCVPHIKTRLISHPHNLRGGGIN